MIYEHNWIPDQQRCALIGDCNFLINDLVNPRIMFHGMRDNEMGMFTEANKEFDMCEYHTKVVLPLIAWFELIRES